MQRERADYPTCAAGISRLPGGVRLLKTCFVCKAGKCYPCSCTRCEIHSSGHSALEGVWYLLCVGVPALSLGETEGQLTMVPPMGTTWMAGGVPCPSPGPLIPSVVVMEEGGGSGKLQLHNLSHKFQ